MRTPYEIDDEDYAAKVEALGEVDVLCSHIPPEVPELLYDTVARRFERGSGALLEAIRRTQPRYVLFGHVHQPLAPPDAHRPHRVRERRALPGPWRPYVLDGVRDTFSRQRARARAHAEPEGSHGGPHQLERSRSTRASPRSWR